MTDVFTSNDLAEAKSHPTLGPAYFASRRIVEGFMAQFEADQFKPLIDKFASQVRDQLWADLENWLLCDTENNLQGHMWRQVDDMVKYMLAGEPWAVERYALASRHDAEKVRKAIAAHIPKELQDARIADLEEEVVRLRKSLEFYRR